MPPANRAGDQFDTLVVVRHKPVLEDSLKPSRLCRVSGRNGGQVQVHREPGWIIEPDLSVFVLPHNHVSLGIDSLLGPIAYPDHAVFDLQSLVVLDPRLHDQTRPHYVGGRPRHFIERPSTSDDGIAIRKRFGATKGPPHRVVSLSQRSFG